MENCESGFHGSLRESLTEDLCKICNRNYEQEKFLVACRRLNIAENFILSSSSKSFSEFIDSLLIGELK